MTDFYRPLMICDILSTEWLSAAATIDIVNTLLMCQCCQNPLHLVVQHSHKSCGLSRKEDFCIDLMGFFPPLYHVILRNVK